MNYPNLARPLLSKELIGRETVLESLTALLDQAASGRPQLVLLAGEAGLGKTRLCQAFIEQARSRQTPLLFGQALPQDQTLPFGPFLDAFRRYYSGLVRPQASAEAANPPGLSFLLRLIPEVAALFPGVTPVPLDEIGTLALQQSRLFHCILSGLRELAHARPAGTPLLIILEDLHWADETSLELVAYLARQLGVNTGSAVTSLAEEPVFILGTYRSEALEENSPFSNWLARTQKQRQLQELTLAPLDPAAHTRLVSNILGQPIPPDQTRLLYRRDEGNPFYTEELLGALRAAGHLSRSNDRWILKAEANVDLPLSLKASILERVRALPQEDRQVLSCAAVIGREFDFEVLAAIAEKEEDTLLAILRRAINLQLLREGPVNPTAPLTNPAHEIYHFRHALMGEAIFGDLLARERRRLHLKIAQTLESRENPPVRILAEQFALAGQPEKARPYALQEAERARQVLAFREERHFLEIGLPSLTVNSPEQLGTLQRLGGLSLALGDIPSTLKWLTEAKDGYEKTGQERQAALVLINLSFLFWFYDPARLTNQMEQLEKASQASLAAEDQNLEALSVYSHTAFSLASGDMNSQAQVWVGRAFELAPKIPDPAAGGAMLFTTLAHGLIQTDGPAAESEGGLAAIQQVVGVALQYNLPELVMLGYSILFTSLVNLGKYERAAALKEEIIAYQDRTNSPKMTNLLVWHDFFTGNWQEAETALREELARHPAPTVDALCRVALAHFLIARHDLAEVPALLETAWEKVQHLQIAYRAPALWGFARYYEANRQSRQAADYYGRLLDDWQTTEEKGLALVFLQDAIEFYVSQDDLWKASRYLKELHRLVADTANPVGQAALLAAEGAVATAEGRNIAAIDVLREAEQKWSELKRPYTQARACLKLARLLLNLPRADKADRKEAGDLLDRAESILRDLGEKQLLEEVENLKRETRLEGQSKRRATLAAARTPFEGLTHREIQVLVQVSAGHSNKEIAQNLSITGATVETHLNHILSKLGCDSRTQAVTYAVGKGWLKPPVRAD